MMIFAPNIPVTNIHLNLYTFQTAHAIRNYVNPLDHVACGFTLGGMYRFIGGPKAMLGK